jgi:hypothetical protein
MASAKVPPSRADTLTIANNISTGVHMKNGLSKCGGTAIIIAALSLCGCLQQLTDLNNSLSRASKMLPSESQVAAPGSSLANLPQMSKPQLQIQQSQLSARTNDRAALQAREEARPVLEKVLSRSACYPRTDVYRYLTAYSIGERGGYPAPMVTMQYHPKSECLTVTRLDNWRMRARNAFSFRAVYVSDASSESATAEYEMIKQPDGAWLLR